MRNVIIWVLVLVGFQFQMSTSQVIEINRKVSQRVLFLGLLLQLTRSVKEDGRGPTIWDKFSHSFDIQLMKDMGMDAYHFSIAWSWIFPNGSGEINQPGTDYYNNIINALLAKGNTDLSKQHGVLGIAFDVFWFETTSNSTKDNEATQRAQDFQLGRSMKNRVESRLPTFSKTEAYLVRGSLDFVSINHYTTSYVKSNSTDLIGIPVNDSIVDSGAITLRMFPSIFASMDDPNDPLISFKDALQDKRWIKYHNCYLSNLLASIKEDSCNVRGYFAWSLTDNWEWTAGYTSRFGLYFVDYKNNLKRYPKQSVQ
ncbi:hypothetical protein NE237_021565 [Protea cynaroides]|uniref:Uncharacterized protein n=1 Tax=Protea cynaroides TaxID=273540 RepID=A0A9Q0K4G8_9MAGN|nr:hypothetical protein NE237_021565 [Protea cynaroides]